MSEEGVWTAEPIFCRRTGRYLPNRSLYKLYSQLGRGNFSVVLAGQHVLTKEKVAVKSCTKDKLSPKIKNMLMREIANLESVYHPNIVRLFDVLETPTKLHLVMEYVNGSTLQMRMVYESKLSEENAKIVFGQLVSALKYLHDKNIIHRDIKAENVLCGPKNVVKLCDFGFSLKLTTGSRQAMHTLCGSLPYVAPELLRECRYRGQPVDIWAMGVLLYYMTSGRLPFHALSLPDMKKSVTLGAISVPAHLSQQCANLIRGMLNVSPDDRLTLWEVRNAEWLSDVVITYPEYGKWSFNPTIKPNEDLAQEEDLTRNRLMVYGIDDQVLRRHVTKGIKNDVLATYRIMMHKTITAMQTPTVRKLPPPVEEPSKICIIM